MNTRDSQCEPAHVVALTTDYCTNLGIILVSSFLIEDQATHSASGMSLNSSPLFHSPRYCPDLAAAPNAPPAWALPQASPSLMLLIVTALPRELAAQMLAE